LATWACSRDDAYCWTSRREAIHSTAAPAEATTATTATAAATTITIHIHTIPAPAAGQDLSLNI